jgi:ABC-type antimicrobial peptide transport system permease subunit
MTQPNRVQLGFEDALRLGFNYLIRRMDRSILNIASIALGLGFYTSLQLTDIFYKAYAEIGGSKLAVESTYFWLLIVALAVSIVGVANAMLISVQERVKEIGTMKCFGALDSHITLLFLIESVIQGAIGGTIGFIFGIGAALLSTGSTTGFGIILRIPLTNLFYLLGTTLFISISLSTIATIYPAFRASKLNPVEALRYEL